MEKATFAAGCFWGVEAAFMEMDGVQTTQVGYTGGSREEPSYKEVCTGMTGHAEAVQMAFDPSIVSYEELLGLFWRVHNPTTLNRQGPDIGHQYRSAIFYHNEEQKAAAEKSREEQNRSGPYKGKVVTEIVEAKTFYPAEEYHQQYFQKRGLKNVCHTG